MSEELKRETGDRKYKKDKIVSLNNKIIENGKIPFKLWLEFEETFSWNDLENDFANIGIDTLDGRKYSLNVWTFNFLNTARKEDIKVEKKDFMIPPDLFVKELTRPCIEKVVKELFSKGNMEEVLNLSVFNLEFLAPYLSVFDMEEEIVDSIIQELKTELPESHSLFNQSVDLIAKKLNNDDIILEFDRGQIAVVQLTWKTEREISGYPITRFYKDKLEFWEKEMRFEILDFKE